jgi:hypothetical protein
VRGRNALRHAGGVALKDPIEWVNPQRRKRRGAVLNDGLGDHFSIEALNELRKPSDALLLPCDMQLRPPHTTQRLQGCDVQNYREFKPLYKKSKNEKLMINLAGMKVVTGVDPRPKDGWHAYEGVDPADRTVKNKLDFFDLMPVLYEPFMESHSRANNLAGWDEDVTLTTAAIEAAVKTAKLHAARKKYSMVSTERWDEGPISDGNTYDISYDIASSQEALAALGA